MVDLSKHGDDLTEEEEEELEAYFRKQVLTTPPTCLAGFKLSGEAVRDDDDFYLWKLTCSCGCTKGKILGFPLKDFRPDASPQHEDSFVSPLAFQCADCEKITEIIDTDLHGFNGALTGRGGCYRGEDNSARKNFSCPKCGATDFTDIDTVFSHPHFDLQYDEPETRDRTQDFFDTFASWGICAACGDKAGFTSFELA